MVILAVVGCLIPQKKGNFGVANDIVDVTLLICGLLIVNLVLELDVLRPV